jgi:hypothetical protein
MIVSGTCRMLSSCGTEIMMTPVYIPKTELVKPINHNGATDRDVIRRSAEFREGASRG